MEGIFQTVSSFVTKGCDLFFGIKRALKIHKRKMFTRPMPYVDIRDLTVALMKSFLCDRSWSGYLA